MTRWRPRPPFLDRKAEWMDRARCTSESVNFYPDRDPRLAVDEARALHLQQVRDAKRVCFNCPVEDECLNYALTNNEMYGIWGGLDESERRRLRSDLRKAKGLET